MPTRSVFRTSVSSFGLFQTSFKGSSGSLVRLQRWVRRRC